MPLHLHRAARTDVLADALAEVLARPLDDPFAEEVVVVPARGVERWLTQRLSHRLGAGAGAADGVCAGVRFLSPRSLVALLTGTERDDPWDPDRLVWPLLEVVDDSLDELWCATLARHLGRGVQDPEQADLRRDRRWSVARRLAGLFASYAVQRPDLLADWQAGRDTDGAGRALTPDLAWEAELWRRLLTRVEAPPPDARHRATLAAIRDGADLALPDRLSLFGHTRLPATEVALLAAVAEVRSVHLWLPHPSPAAWTALAPLVAGGAVPRATDDCARGVAHPLLSSLGRDSRELQRALTGLGPVLEQTHDDPPAPDPAGLLARLQADLRADAPGGRPSGDPADRSVQVHACHGMTRQVEVLREVLVGLFEDDPTLEPRDVLVMCPDVETYAPLLASVFGLGETVGSPVGTASEPPHPAHLLRVRLADRGLLSTNPMLALAVALVGVAGGRATATEVLDVLGSPPVRHRFGLSEDDVATMTTWVEQSGVRWGLAADLRTPYRLGDLRQNTWRAGLDRVLLGVAVAEHEEGAHLAGTLPLDDVGSAAVDLAGRLAEAVDRLEHVVRDLGAATTLGQWLDALTAGVAALGSVPATEAWQEAQFRRELAQVREAAAVEAAGTGGTTLRLADVRRLLEQRTAPRPTRASFRTGTLTVATLVPMRSVPHRVVCLVGLDDGVFPRGTVLDGDDVLARDPVTGERDPRSEDRQLLLDAVMSATETLVVTYTGAHEHSGRPRPPAVPLGELLDALELTEAGARDRVLVRHPLQPFDARSFTPGALGSPAPFSFDRAAAAGAAAGTRPRTPRPALLDAPLPVVREPDVRLADLQAFLQHPARAFLRQRLDVGVPLEHDEVEDALPVELDALQRWALGDRILRQALAGRDPVAVFDAEQRRGLLPPDGLGRLALREVVTGVDALWRATAEDRVGESRSVDVTVDLGGGRRLTGVVPDVRGDRVVRIHYSSLGGKHRLASWVDLLALSAADPDRAWTARTVGRFRKDGVRTSLLGPVDHRAPDLLTGLVDLLDRGRAEPLPLPLRTAYAYAEAVRAHRDPVRAAQYEWETREESPVPGEQDDPAQVRLLGRRRPLAALLGPVDDQERWNDQTTRLGQYACRLWEPLFAHERVW